MEKTRYEKWDNIKGVLIYLVVLGHISDMYRPNSTLFQSLFFYIYIFHMPLFIFITGLFSKNSINYKRYDKISFFLFLYLFLKIVYLVRNILFYGDTSFSLFTEKSARWYMLAIFFMHLAVICLKQFNKVFVVSFAILLACAVGYDPSINSFLALSRFFVFFPFFILGYYFDAKRVLDYFSDYRIKISSFIFLLVGAVITVLFIKEINWLAPILTGHVPYTMIPECRKWGFLVRLFYYPVVCVFCASIISVIPDKAMPFISKFGKNSLAIYAFHNIFYKTLYDMNIASFMKAILPVHTNILVIPLAFFVTLFCSLDIFSDFLNFLRKKFDFQIN